MNLNEKKLTSFYFGALPDNERLEIEREMLEDPEILVDYLDLKRRLESATPVPAQASQALWHRLRPQSVPPKVWWLSLAVGAALAATFCFWMLRSGPAENGTTSPSGILFDTGPEHSTMSNVL